MIGLVIGLFLGGAVGFFIAALLHMAGEEDEAMESELHKLEDARTFTWWQE